MVTATRARIVSELKLVITNGETSNCFSSIVNVRYLAVLFGFYTICYGKS